MISSLSDDLNKGERFIKLEPGINLQAYTPPRKGRDSTVPRRNFGCRLTSNLTLEGFEMVVLENELFRLAVLPGKGTDLVELLHKPTDTDFMWWTALGLQPGNQNLSDFQAQYEGGWQEIFPNLAETHIHDGTKLDAYGEVSLVAWSHRIVCDTPEHVAVCFFVNLQTMPFRLEKIIHLRRGVPGFELEQRAINLSNVALYADWGQHITFGEPFLMPGSRLELPSNTRPEFTIPERGTAGGFEVLSDLNLGRYRVQHPDGIGLQLEWDLSVWKHLWFWRDFGGERAAPYFGKHFNIGLELFSSPPAETLNANVAAGTALRFEPGQTRTAWLRFEVTDER